MADSLQQKTTSCGLKGNTTRYRSDSPPPAEHVSFAPEIVGRRYGHVEITSPEKRWKKGWREARVLVRCTGCGQSFWAVLSNLTRGLSKGCQSCSTPTMPYPKWMDRRFTAAKQRCTNPKDKGYPNYGARGIEFRFAAVSQACLWMMETHGVPDRNLELDRIDTNGHYEPGNLRWVTKAENRRNKRNVSMKDGWDADMWPYARTVVMRMVNKGMTREQVLETARLAVKERRKNWRGIAKRLASLTS